MQSGANEAASFIPILYDTLEKNGLGNVSLTCCDASKYLSFAPHPPLSRFRCFYEPPSLLWQVS